MITDVYLFRTGDLLAYAHAEVIEDYQSVGDIDALLTQTTPDTRYHVGNWGIGVRAIGMLEFLRIAEEIKGANAS